MKVFLPKPDLKQLFVGSFLKSQIEERIETFLMYRFDNPQDYDAEDLDAAEELKEYFEGEFAKDKVNVNALNVQFFVSEIEDFEREHVGRISNDIKRFYIDSGIAELIDIDAYKAGLIVCTGGLKGLTWFTYKKERYSFNNWLKNKV